MAADTEPESEPTEEEKAAAAAEKPVSLETALQEARERLTAGKGITAEKTDAGSQEGEKGAEGEGGEEGEEGEEGEGNEGEEAEGDNVSDEAEGEEAEPEPEEQPGKEADAVVTAEGEGEKPKGEEPEDPDPDLVVTLPARREGEDELELVLEDKEAVERIRQLRNGYMRGEETRAAQAQIVVDQGQIEEMETWISTDPVGFIVSNLPEQTTQQVAMSLITAPKVWDAVKEQLAVLQEDPNELRVIQAELKSQRLEMTSQLKTLADGRKQAREVAHRIEDGIQKLVPVSEGLPDGRRDKIIADLQVDIAKQVRERQLVDVRVDDLPLMAAAVLRSHGIDPIAAAKLLADGGVEPEPGKSPAKAKQPTGKELVQARKKRKKAAASAPPGADALVTRPKLPKGQRLEDRLALAREKGLAALAGR